MASTAIDLFNNEIQNCIDKLALTFKVIEEGV